MKLRELGEDRLLGQLLPSLSIRKDVLVGAGDDCAVVRFPSENRLLLLKAERVLSRGAVERPAMTFSSPENSAARLAGNICDSSRASTNRAGSQKIFRFMP